MLKLKVAMISGLVLTSALILGGCTDTTPTLEAKDKALQSFKTVFESHADKIGYHKVLKHWNFKMPSGELFEWTKDVGENKADYAMVLYAEPFIKAGLDPKKLNDAQWLFQPAEVEDGKQLPDRLIHPFNIEDKPENSNGWEDALRRVLNKQPAVVTYIDSSKTTSLALGEGFRVEMKETEDPKKSEFTFTIQSSALVKAGLDISKLGNSGWVSKGTEQLERVYKLN